MIPIKVNSSQTFWFKWSAEFYMWRVGRAGLFAHLRPYQGDWEHGTGGHWTVEVTAPIKEEKP